jgi:hypothetical protein
MEGFPSAIVTQFQKTVTSFTHLLKHPFSAAATYCA